VIQPCGNKETLDELKVPDDIDKVKSAWAREGRTDIPLHRDLIQSTLRATVCPVFYDGRLYQTESTG